MNENQIRAELERLRAENEVLKSRSSKDISLKVSEKGALSVYGLGRFPVTLYKQQWLKLLEKVDDIRKFISENESKLRTLDQGRFLQRPSRVPLNRSFSRTAP